ncbi:MAG TPA: hypothetical protein VM364_01660 [Vicinamibacterales bacterium]|nr:hypothetical protein [Vicinamibacterales bacterium]
MDDVDYCREIEAYLCQKNGGHLVRIVGPAFETVCGWAEQGVPLKVAFRGIDRCVERANAKGGRRRPMRIEFCEADVLEAFDDWRRALGVTAVAVPAGDAGDEEESRPSRKDSLPAHIERVLSRLLAARTGPPHAAFDETIARVTRELDEFAASRGARGEARARIIARLGEIDRALLAAARETLDAATTARLQREADAELAGFASRMPPEGLARARQLAFERLLRESLNLPVVAYE